ncbi:serine hydrolase [Nitzschia inconspicua]|uniref:Serine hydrolase n=1 Tax=Nitzschia inconspicua TaxID=303405 RepID=A0A9K3M4K3_9STRA|nr:serine hydrolase [Nitzschia inconspicua]
MGDGEDIDRENKLMKDVSDSFHQDQENPSSSSSMLLQQQLRVLCLHDACSNAYDFSRQLDALSQQLFHRHGIELDFVNSPLLTKNEKTTSTDTTTRTGSDTSTTHAPRTTTERNDTDTDTTNTYRSVGLDSPPRIWWEEQQDMEPNQPRPQTYEGMVQNNEEIKMTTHPGSNKEQNYDQPVKASTTTATTTTTKRYVGLDASLLLLRQIWTSATPPYWGILAMGQGASVASILALMELPTPKPFFCVFVHGMSLLPETENLNLDDIPCLHIVIQNPAIATTTTTTTSINNEPTERLIRQFGGTVIAVTTTSSTSTTSTTDQQCYPPTAATATVCNAIGKFLVQQKKRLKRQYTKARNWNSQSSHQRHNQDEDANIDTDTNTDHDDITVNNNDDTAAGRVLALQQQLYLVQQEAARFVAQEIAQNPPRALMAVISPQQVVAASTGTVRQAFGAQGGGAPCPSEFLLHRHKRTNHHQQQHNDTNGPSRQHPSNSNYSTSPPPPPPPQQQQQGEQGTNTLPNSNAATTPTTATTVEQPPTTIKEASTSSTTTSTANICDTSPLITVLLENPTKGTNWGPLLRCCVAFGIDRIYTVGYDQCAVQGSHGAHRHIELVSFPTHQAAVDHLTNHERFQLVGLLKGHAQQQQQQQQDESTENEDNDNNKSSNQLAVERTEIPIFTENDGSHDGTTTSIVRVAVPPSSSNHDTATSNILPDCHSLPAHCRQFPSRTCLVLDKRKDGLGWDLAQHCSKFVHIPHYHDSSNDGTRNGFLTLEACLSIVLFEFTTSWANNTTNEHNHYQGQKYHVAHIQKGSGTATKVAEQKRRDRRAAIEEMLLVEQIELEEKSAATNLFDDKNNCINGTSLPGDY